MIEKIENGLIALASLIGLANMESILGIIILAFQLVIILYKFGVKIYNKIKKKEYDSLLEDIEQATSELKQLQDEIRSTQDEHTAD